MHFVRLVGDEVVRVEVMKVSGEKIVRTEKEVDLEAGSTLAKSKDEPVVRPAGAPSLRRPGEESDEDSREDNGTTVRVPAAIPGRPDPSTPPPHYLSLR